jgi:hypothetical protein
MKKTAYGNVNCSLWAPVRACICSVLPESKYHILFSNVKVPCTFKVNIIVQWFSLGIHKDREQNKNSNLSKNCMLYLHNQRKYISGFPYLETQRSEPIVIYKP